MLWREYGYRPFQDGWSENPAHRGAEDAAEGRWLPIAAYNAMSSYAKTGEEVEGALIEANLDDAEMTPAETVRALLASANTAKVLLKEARQYMKRLPFDMAKRLDAALGEGA